MEGSQSETARPRREDAALVTGSAEYTDDVRPPGTVHAALLRCPYGHARVEQVDVDPAIERDDVIAAFGARELADAGGPTGIPTTNHFPGPDTVERPLLVGERARFAGEPVAVVLAEGRYAAHDALDAIDVEYERLPAVTDPREVATSEGPDISDHGSDTTEWTGGDEAAVDRAFERADRTVSLDLENQRLISAPMETRAVLAEYGTAVGAGTGGRDSNATDEQGPVAEGQEKRLTVTTSTQTPHRDRDRIAETLGLPEDRVRVIAPAVGGGFGPKGSRPYPEEPLVAWCAMHLGRPVKWVATRTEGHRTDQQGRDVHVHAELAVDDDGSLRGLRIRGVVGIGGYPFRSPRYCLRPNLLTGAYELPSVHCRLTGALTNVPPLGPYRGAGRPEAIYVVERLMDRAAAELGMDPAELRRRNFVPPDAFPHETALGYTYDSGDYEAAFDLALEHVDYDGFRERQATLREEDRYLGVGIASFVENTGSSWTESGRVEIDEAGAVTAYCGTADQGQGHGTTFAQLLADEIGVEYEDVEVVEGDTDDLETGTGTFASRSVSVGGAVLVECAREVIEEGKPIAARHLEAAPADLHFEDGAYFVSGAPERTASLATVARLAHEGESGGDGGGDGGDGDGGSGGDSGGDAAGVGGGDSDGDGGSGSDGDGDGTAEPALEAELVYEPEGQTYAFGTHVAVVEVDPDSGEIAVERYVAVDDCGVQINPTLVEGQIHGAVAQGLGQALWEEAVYDDNGSLLTGSFQDYAMPRAHTMPELETDSTVTPSPLTPHGAKGAGEAGTTAAPPAVVNAVVDALEPFGVERVDMPLTPERVWQATSEGA